MLDFTKIPLHELLAVAANKARSHMGEGRAHVHFQEMLEAAARWSKAHYDDNAQRMFDVASALSDAAIAVDCETEEPEGEDDFAEEGRVFRGARAL